MRDKGGKIIIGTGGTGGHIFAGIAIAKELEVRGVEVLFVGSRFGMERSIVQGKYPLRLTWQRALVGRKLKEKLEFPLFLIVSFFQSMYILLKERPSGVIGTGGFGSFSIIFISALFGLPTIITEVDSLPGLTTRILSRFVFEVCLAFESAQNRLPSRPTKVIGFPVREGITKRTKTIEEFGLKAGKPTILVLGGSRGAYKINQVVKEVVKLLPEFQFIWQTGAQTPSLSSPIDKQKVEANVWVSEFIEDMGSAYGNVDLAIARAGALTIGELAIVGVPSILIPYPYAAGEHQLKNAKILEKKGAARVVLEKDLTPQILANEIRKLIEDKELQIKMKTAIKKFSTPNTAKLIAKRMIKLCSDKIFTDV